MNNQQSRRNVLKLLTAGVAASGVGCSLPSKHSMQTKPVVSTMQDNWSNTFDRTWLGGEYWANPMEDWHIVDGGYLSKFKLFIQIDLPWSKLNRKYIDTLGNHQKKIGEKIRSVKL